MTFRRMLVDWRSFCLESLIVNYTFVILFLLEATLSGFKKSSSDEVYIKSTIRVGDWRG